MLYKYFFTIVVSFFSSSITAVLGSDRGALTSSNTTTPSSDTIIPSLVPSDILSLTSEAPVATSNSTTQTQSSSGALEALESVLAAATSAVRSYALTLPTSINIPSDDDNTPSGESSGATRAITLSAMGVAGAILVALAV